MLTEAVKVDASSRSKNSAVNVAGHRWLRRIVYSQLALAVAGLLLSRAEGGLAPSTFHINGFFGVMLIPALLSIPLAPLAVLTIVRRKGGSVYRGILAMAASVLSSLATFFMLEPLCM